MLRITALACAHLDAQLLGAPDAAEAAETWLQQRRPRLRMQANTYRNVTYIIRCYYAYSFKFGKLVVEKP